MKMLPTVWFQDSHKGHLLKHIIDTYHHRERVEVSLTARNTSAVSSGSLDWTTSFAISPVYNRLNFSASFALVAGVAQNTRQPSRQHYVVAWLCLPTCCESVPILSISQGTVSCRHRISTKLLLHTLPRHQSSQVVGSYRCLHRLQTWRVEG